MHYQACYTYLRAALGARAARLRTALADGDRGASAVELAVITAVILVIAVALLGDHPHLRDDPVEPDPEHQPVR